MDREAKLKSLFARREHAIALGYSTDFIDRFINILLKAK